MFDIIRASDNAFEILVNITDEAIFLLDENGIILEANIRAISSLGLTADEFKGIPITEVFYSLMYMPMPEGSFPMDSDGFSATLLARLGDERFVTVEAHSNSFILEGKRYHLLAARNIDTLRESMTERGRLMQELARSNKRLTGLLAIISSTLGNPDVDYLNRQILDKLADFIDADGAVLYFVEGNGYRIRGVAERTPSLAVGTYFVSKGSGIVGMVDRSRSTIGVQFATPLEDEERTLPIAIDLESKERMQIKTKLDSVFGTVLAVPVFNHDSVIAIIEVGWESRRSIDKADVALMEAVAEYLAVEFISAASSVAHMRQEELDSTLEEISSMLRDGGKIGPDIVRDINTVVRKTLPFEFLPVTINGRQGVATLEQVLQDGTHQIPIPGVHVQNLRNRNTHVIERGSALSHWLDETTDLSHGLFIDLGDISGSQVAFFILRPSSTVPFDSEEISFVEELTTLVMERAARSEELAQESYISQALQFGMRNDLPKTEGIESVSLYSSATKQAYIGGDFFDLFELPGDRICVLLGDISGKGVQAASMASLLKTAVAAYAWTSDSPAEVVTSVDELFRNFSRTEAFATLFVGVIDLSSGTGKYCSAGHPPALLYHQSTDDDGIILGELELLTSQSPIVGAFEGMKFINGSFDFTAGDTLFLYTDGVIEARSSSRSFFGEEGLREAFISVVDEPLDELPTKILGFIEDFAEGSLDDDVAMVAVRFQRPPQAPIG